jgi:lactam utilization protein B
MTDEQTKQRIAYLVEHGGLYEDPIADVRRTARIALAISSVVLVLSVVELAYVMT